MDPMVAAELIAAKSKYAGKMYFQFEAEDSWDRPGVCAFSRVNGGLSLRQPISMTEGASPCSLYFTLLKLI